MALTERDGRASVVTVALPFARAWMDPDSSLGTEGDRQQMTYSYRLAGSLVDPTGGTVCGQVTLAPRVDGTVELEEC